MATNTFKLNLVKPGLGDNVDITELNGNMDILDDAVTATITSPVSGEALVYDGTNWVNDSVAATLEDLTDTDISSPANGEVLEYDGTNWVNAAGTVGGLVAVKSAINTGPESFGSVAAGANVAVPDLSITHEVSDPANRLIISAFFGVAGITTGLANVGLAVHDGSGLIAVGSSVGSRTALTAGGVVGGNVADQTVAMPSVTFVHTPGAGSKTYTVRAVNPNSSTETIYINRPETHTDVVDISRGVSSFVIQEVAV